MARDSVTRPPVTADRPRRSRRRRRAAGWSLYRVGPEPIGADRLVELVDEPSLATDVREQLSAFRMYGLPFEAAWARAMQSLPTSVAGMDEWRAHLHATKEAWRKAYERR